MTSKIVVNFLLLSFLGESLSLFAKSPKKSPVVAITGASGLIGTQLTLALKSRGYSVISITTKKTATSENNIKWDPSTGEINASTLEGVDSVIHLAGENISSGEGPLGAIIPSWTPTKKSKILNSRVDGTRLIVETITKLKKKPSTFLSASGVGIYGYTDFNTAFDENFKSDGSGFLAEVSRAWEAEALKANKANIRTVVMRNGVVLSNRGGVLGKLLPLFAVGGGGDIGNGKQPFSWVSIDDAVSAIIFCLEKSSLSGPVNVCSPNPVTNAEFTKSLGKALNRPTIIPFPEFAAKLLFGQLGEELLIGGQRVIPSKLIKAGFQFKDDSIDKALKSVLDAK